MNPSSLCSAEVSRPASHPAVALAFLLLLLLWPVAAAAHGDLQGTIPEKGSTLQKPPDHLIINFTEAPAEQSAVSVEDGCSDEVVDQLEFEDKVAHVFLTSAEPGKWKVSYEVVSAVDGHKTKGSYSLTVRGKADCSGGSKSDDGGTGPGPQAGGGPGETTDEDEDGSFPVVPVVIGSAGLVALAVLARRLSG